MFIVLIILHAYSILPDVIVVNFIFFINILKSNIN